MQCDASTLCKALQAVRHHLCAELPKPFPLQPEIDNAKGAIRKVDDRTGQGLIERSVGVAETGDTGEISERLAKGIAESDAAVFGGVMVVDYDEHECVSVTKRTMTR